MPACLTSIPLLVTGAECIYKRLYSDVVVVHHSLYWYNSIGEHDYLIKKLIGKGAFATIYLAIDDKGNKKALKVVNKTTLYSNYLSLQVQSPSCPWEYYISEELRYRLVQSNMDLDVVSGLWCLV